MHLTNEELKYQKGATFWPSLYTKRHTRCSKCSSARKQHVITYFTSNSCGRANNSNVKHLPKVFATNLW